MVESAAQHLDIFERLRSLRIKQCLVRARRFKLWAGFSGPFGGVAGERSQRGGLSQNMVACL